LEEKAHEEERTKAAERRQKKKERKASKKKKHKPASAEDVVAEEHEDELHEEEEELEEEEEDVLPDLEAVKSRMQKNIDSFAEYLRRIRGATPTVELFDDVVVEVYGSRTPLKAVAQVVIGDPPVRAEATCFDPGTAKQVASAIAMHLELNPSTGEGGVVTIPLPRVSLEVRQGTAAGLKKRAESYKQRIRKVRAAAMGPVKQGVAGKLEHVSKDDAFRLQQEIEAATESAIHTIQKLTEEKHTQIMEG
jgi:ribosome recycling factor